jgi:hypothetical protein
MQHFNYPLINPVKLVKCTNTVHFDDSLTVQRLRSYEFRTYYRQKWVRSDTTKLQMQSSLAPDAMKVYDVQAHLVKSLSWTAVYTATDYKIWELTFDLSDLPEGVYFTYQKVALLGITWEAFSEPIHSKNSWPNTLLIEYKNSFNDFGVAWTTGLTMKFRVEADIKEPDFKSDRTDYANQVRRVSTLKNVPCRVFRFNVGEAPGVSPYIVDILNRIFGCDWIQIEGKFYQADLDAKWEKNQPKNYPLMGASLDIVEAEAVDSLSFSDTTPLAPGIVTAYNIETALFGGPAIVPILDVEKQSD